MNSRELKEGNTYTLITNITTYVGTVVQNNNKNLVMKWENSTISYRHSDLYTWNFFQPKSYGEL